MKIKPIFLVMLVCLLTLSFVFVSCKTDDDDSSGGATFPTELHGTWTQGSEVITIAATTLTYEGDAGNLTGKNGNRYTINWNSANISFDAVITSGNLVISNTSTNMFPDGTFTK